MPFWKSIKIYNALMAKIGEEKGEEKIFFNRMRVIRKEELLK
jgi:hypothetical protein